MSFQPLSWKIHTQMVSVYEQHEISRGLVSQMATILYFHFNCTDG